VKTKFNIITKTTYKDFCDKTSDIQIVENNLEMRMVTLLDKFGNISLLEYDADHVIISLCSVEKHDPAYLLYLLVTLTDAVFLSENNYKNCIQIPLIDKLGINTVEIETSTYEEFTRYFKENIKWARDFDKESQLTRSKWPNRYVIHK
jgi:hypothetical protein